jgi:hypothetical protein
MNKFDFNYGEMGVFDHYFAGIVAMAHCHPGSGKSNGNNWPTPKLTLEECAEKALDMIRIRRELRSTNET